MLLAIVPNSAHYLPTEGDMASSCKTVRIAPWAQCDKRVCDGSVSSYF
jgi:hypothetical protein